MRVLSWEVSHPFTFSFSHISSPICFFFSSFNRKRQPVRQREIPGVPSIKTSTDLGRRPYGLWNVVLTPYFEPLPRFQEVLCVLLRSTELWGERWTVHSLWNENGWPRRVLMDFGCLKIYICQWTLQKWPSFVLAQQRVGALLKTFVHIDDLLSQNFTKLSDNPGAKDSSRWSLSTCTVLPSESGSELFVKVYRLGLPILITVFASSG